MRRILVFSVVLSLFLLGGAGPAHAETITIEADDNEFVPEEVTAQVGDTIVFENVGSAPHIATASDDSFDTGNLNPGDSAEVTLEEEGTIEYVCSYHVALGMEGTIIVEAAAGAPAGGEEEEAGEEEADEEEAEEDSDAAASDEGEDDGDGAAGGEDSDSAAEEEDVVPTQKYFPPLGVGLFVLMLLGLAPAVKEYLIPAMTASKEDTEPEPVGAPPSLAVTASAPPAAALTAAPQAPAAPAAAPEAAPAAPPATSAVPATQAPTPGPTDPPLDPEKVFQAVMADETQKGTDPSVAEARAKAAKGRAEEALEMSKAPAEAPSAPAAVAPTAASEAPPEAAPPAPAAAPAPSGPTMSDEEAAEIRAKVKEEELAKGSDPRVAEGRAKAAELRAKKGTSGPK